MSQNRLASERDMSAAQRARIDAAVNRLVALDALPCDLLDLVAARFIKNADQNELDSARGTLRILLSALDRAASVA